MLNVVLKVLLMKFYVIVGFVMLGISMIVGCDVCVLVVLL